MSVPKFTAPSSTIKAATLAGLGMAFFWGTLSEFTSIEISAQYVSLSSTFVSAIVGYFKKERVLQPGDVM
jgi:hypothetical protein